MGAMRLGCAAAILLATNACAPLVVQQSARTVRPGQMQAGMSMSAIHLASEDEEFDEKSSDVYVGMMPNGWARFGLAEGFDAGLQFYGGGVRADGKFAPVQTEAFAFAIAGGLSGGYQTQSGDDEDFTLTTTKNSHWFGDVGPLFTVGIGPSLDVNLAGRVLIGESFTEDEFDGETTKESLAARAFGGAIGVAVKRSNWTFSPEIAVYQLTSEDTETEDSSTDTLAILPSIGFSVGF